MADHMFPRIAVVGAGYWGKNLIRNFHSLGHLSVICDSRQPLLDQFAEEYPDARMECDFDALLDDDAVDAVVLATPSVTHHPLGLKVLHAKKHLYVEKPLATNFPDAKALVDLARANKKTLMVGHLLMYHPAIIRVKQLMDSGALGEIRYIQSDRLNYNHGRHDRNVMWDLSPHDLSVLVFLGGGQMPSVRQVEAINVSPKDDLIDMLHLSFEFPSGVVAHLQTSWIYPKKQVQLLVVGSEASLILDDTLPLDKRLLKITFDEQGQRHEELMPYLALEPLRLECQHFINALKGDWTPKSDERNGLAIVALLESAQSWID